MLGYAKSFLAACAALIVLSTAALASHVSHDDDVSEPFTAVGALADTDLPPQAKAGSGRKLQRHGTRGFKSRRWAIDLPGRGRTVALRRQQRVSGDGRGVTWLGQVEGAQGGMVAITTRDGLINGFIDDGRRYWVIENAGQGLYKLFEIDTSQTPPPAAPLGQANEPGGESGAGGGTQAAGGTVIQDLLVAFTPEVTARYGGVTATVNAINNHVAAINQSYSNSQVNIQMNLVGTVELGQAQSGNMSTTLSRLRSTTDGYYDEVHPLRDELGADLVAMLTTETGYCGIAYLNHPQFSGEDRYAFSVTSAYSGYACLPLTLPHEIGHNQGLCHNREETGCTNPAYAYGYGYRVCGSFRTIMSYSCTGATRIYHIANPAVLYNGMPTGILHSVDPNNSSEASRALNDSAADVAAWRAGCAVVSAPAAPTLLAAAAASSTEIGLSWTDNASDETAFEVERSPDGSSWTKIATVGASGGTGNTVNFNDTGLAASTTYHYQVRAINCAGNSAYAGPASDTTQEPPPAPPAVPDGLVAVFDGLNTVNLTWNAATGADYYEVLRQEKTGKGKNAWDAMTTLETNIAGTSFDDTPVTAGATYRYYVRSWASDGQSSAESAPLQVKLSGDTGGGGGGGGSGCTKGKKKNCGDS